MSCGRIGKEEVAAFAGVAEELFALGGLVGEVGHAEGVGVDVDDGLVRPDGVGVDDTESFTESVPVHRAVIRHEILRGPAPRPIVQGGDGGAMEEHAVVGGHDRVRQGIRGIGGVDIPIVEEPRKVRDFLVPVVLPVRGPEKRPGDGRNLRGHRSGHLDSGWNTWRRGTRNRGVGRGKRHVLFFSCLVAYLFMQLFFFLLFSIKKIRIIVNKL